MVRFRIKVVSILLSIAGAFAVQADDAPNGKVVMRVSPGQSETGAPRAWLIPLSLLERPRDEWAQEEKGIAGSEPPAAGRPFQPIPERLRQQVLLVGHMTAGNKFYMNVSGFGEFQIIDGYVHYPQRFAFYREQKKEKLDALIAAITGGGDRLGAETRLAHTDRRVPVRGES